MEVNKNKQKNILICFSGSVATIKDKLLITKFLKNGFNVKLIYTDASVQFSSLLKDSAPYKHKIGDIQNNNYKLRNISTFTLQENHNSESKIECFFDKNESENWKCMGDPVLHIILKNWADLILIAPLSANTLAKIANGYSNNLLVISIYYFIYL